MPVASSSSLHQPSGPITTQTSSPKPSTSSGRRITKPEMLFVPKTSASGSKSAPTIVPKRRLSAQLQECSNNKKAKLIKVICRSTSYNDLIFFN